VLEIRDHDFSGTDFDLDGRDVVLPSSSCHFATLTKEHLKNRILNLDRSGAKRQNSTAEPIHLLQVGYRLRSGCVSSPFYFLTIPRGSLGEDFLKQIPPRVGSNILSTPYFRILGVGGTSFFNRANAAQSTT